MAAPLTKPFGQSQHAQTTQLKPQFAAASDMRFSIPLVLALIVLGLGPGCRAPQTEKPASTLGKGRTTGAGSSYSDPNTLTALNKLFLEAYRERQLIVRTNVRPLLVGNFSTLELYWDGHAETNRCIPDIYHSLKAVAHVPFGVYLRTKTYAGENNATAPDSLRQALKTYLSQIETTASSLPSMGFSEAQLVRQKRILAMSQAYASNVVATAKTPASDLMTFARDVGPLLLENANEAAAAQLDMTHAAVMAWKKRVPADEWKQLVVVVPGPQMPRRMNILTQYFARLLGEPSHHLGYPLESRRLIYAETIFGSRDYLDLMATTFIDGDAGEAFFGDHWRMSRDVLADGAEEYLKKLSFE
jgi:hypothetical protein